MKNHKPSPYNARALSLILLQVSGEDALLHVALAPLPLVVGVDAVREAAINAEPHHNILIFRVGWIKKWMI